MVPSFLLRSYLMYAAYIVIWIPSVRLQCSSTAVLEAACQGLGSNNHLADDPDPVTISMCPLQSGLSHIGWSLSPDSGSESVLDTSLPKYTDDGRRLTISNINGTDEGLYRCVYQPRTTMKIACIYVYGRAVFASCPQAGSLASCANNPTSLSVEDRGDVMFDAMVIHTPGGSCGFRQVITHVRLKKLNPEFDVPDDLLLPCDTSEVSACGKSRVSLSRGNDPGYDFVFTLTGANVSDSGMYKVEVEVVHPKTGSGYEIIKMFYLNVTARSRPPTTNPVDTATATSMATVPGFTDDSSSVAILSTATSPSPSNRQDNLSIVIPIAVVVPVAIAALVLAAIGIGYKTTRKSKLSVEKFSDKEQSQVRTIEHDGPRAPVEETGDMVLRMHLNGAIQNDTNTVTELPPSNNRISLIEQDSGIFSHLNSTDSPAVNV